MVSALCCSFMDDVKHTNSEFLVVVVASRHLGHFHGLLHDSYRAWISCDFFKPNAFENATRLWLPRLGSNLLKFSSVGSGAGGGVEVEVEAEVEVEVEVEARWRWRQLRDP